MKTKILLLLFAFSSVQLSAQNVGINGTGAAPNAAAMLDVASTNSGVLFPRMTAAQRAAIAAPVAGLLVYQTDVLIGFWYYDGTQWVYLSTNNEYNNKFQDVGTAGLAVTTTGFTAVPGLTRTVTLLGPAKVTITVDGGIQTTSGAAAGYSSIDVVLAQNAAFLNDGGYKRVMALNNGGIGGAIENYSMCVTLTLPAGTYTFAVYAAKAAAASANATVSGNNTSVLQGIMTTEIVYQ